MAIVAQAHLLLYNLKQIRYNQILTTASIQNNILLYIQKHYTYKPVSQNAARFARGIYL